MKKRASKYDYKKVDLAEAEVFLKKTQMEYLEKCNGYKSFFDFLQKEYGANPIYWVRTARKLGYEIIKKNNNFYLKIDINDTSRDQ